MTSFGDFIRQEREKKGWTQTDLGYQLKVNSTKISRIENNKDALNASKLSILSELYEIELSKIKELYFGDKFAREAYKNGCSEKTFAVAEETVQYYRAKNARQTKLEF
jgi:transcriptional regulator with XRE-family HTH domain